MNKLEVRFNLPDDRSQRGCNFIFQAVAASDWFLFISVTGCCWVYCLQPAAAQTCCSLSQSPRTLVMPAVCMEGVWSKLVHSPVHTGERNLHWSHTETAGILTRIQWVHYHLCCLSVDYWESISVSMDTPVPVVCMGVHYCPLSSLHGHQESLLSLRGHVSP